MFLNLKGWSGKVILIDVVANKHLAPHCLGINPRGLVPAILEDGVFHIESNDITFYLEREHAEPPLVLDNNGQEIATLLYRENNLHLNFRTWTATPLRPQHGSRGA